MWMYEQNGHYTVKSGYRVLQSWKNEPCQNSSTSNAPDSVWKKLWRIHSIPRHKMIIWRILNNSLPLRPELVRRGIQVSPLCPRCNAKMETTTHTFKECPKVTRIWFGLNLSLCILNQPITNFIDCLYHIINNEDENTIIQAASIIYHIWWLIT
jgi:hypothetical protein